MAVFLPKTGELITGDVVAGQRAPRSHVGRGVVGRTASPSSRRSSPAGYPGHGAPGGAELLDETLTYLEDVPRRRRVEGQAGRAAKNSRADANDVKKSEMMARYPSSAHRASSMNRFRAEVCSPGSRRWSRRAGRGHAAHRKAPTTPTDANPAGASTSGTPPASATSLDRRTTRRPRQRPARGASGGMDDLLGSDTSSSSKSKKKKKSKN